MKKQKRVLYLETEVRCPNCCNFLLEIVKLPSDVYIDTDEDELLLAKRLGYYCSECRTKFDLYLKNPD
jgi:DNA-directed RNA polymerase subunit RPC12/RpoP